MNHRVKQRIRQIREAVDLTQAEFGAKLGQTKSVIVNIELNRNKNDVPPNFLKHICETFNVNENWLQTGLGEMFVKVDNSSLSALKKEYNLSQKATAILENFLNLSDKERDEFSDLAEKVFNDSKEDTEIYDSSDIKIIHSSTDDSQFLAAESSLLDGDSKIFEEE